MESLKMSSIGKTATYKTPKKRKKNAQKIASSLAKLKLFHFSQIEAKPTAPSTLIMTPKPRHIIFNIKQSLINPPPETKLIETTLTDHRTTPPTHQQKIDKYTCQGYD
jgi:hypothetical protein